MGDVSRREFLGAGAAVAGALASDALRAENAAGGDARPTLPPAFSDSLTAPALPFEPAKLRGISEKLIRSHYDNNYLGALKTLNAVRARLGAMLADKDAPPWAYNDLKREQLVRHGSVVLHELYFANLGGDGQADGALRTRIGAAFGSFDAWETEFRRVGAGLGGGSGWVVLGFDTHTGAIENHWLADHAHGPVGVLPLLVMDMYEHAYQMDYGAAAAKYIDAFFTNIRWDVVGRRLEAAGKLPAPFA